MIFDHNNSSVEYFIVRVFFFFFIVLEWELWIQYYNTSIKHIFCLVDHNMLVASWIIGSLMFLISFLTLAFCLLLSNPVSFAPSQGSWHLPFLHLPPQCSLFSGLSSNATVFDYQSGSPPQPLDVKARDWNTWPHHQQSRHLPAQSRWSISIFQITTIPNLPQPWAG